MDRYIFKNLTIATVFVTVILIVIMFLTQSLKFLELVINSGADAHSFWILTFLALPRFFEIILPLALITSVLFIYNRMIMDSEIIVIKSGGYSPEKLTKPVVILAVIITIFLWFSNMWAAPKALSQMNVMRQMVKAQVSSFLFREGVFNQIGKGLTLYVRDRSSSGELHGVMIHDNRDKQKPPSVTLAKKGIIVANEDGYGVIVSDGSRQEYNKETRVLSRLEFKSYTIDIPHKQDVRDHWQEPDERTIFELLNPDISSIRDRESLREFRVEIHRRVIGPLIAPVFGILGCAFLLLGPLNRRGQSTRIMTTIVLVVVIQSLFIVASNLSRQNDWGIVFMYSVVLLPLIVTAWILWEGRDQRQSKMYKHQKASS